MQKVHEGEVIGTYDPLLVMEQIHVPKPQYSALFYRSHNF